MAPWEAAAPRFCHFDLLSDNFVVDDARASGGGLAVTIVDFEYCEAGQPLMDLAVLSMGCALDAAAERRLVASYLQKAALDDADAQRFQALKMLATLRETFWGVVAEVSGTSALSPEAAAAYTDLNYAKHKEVRREFEENLAGRAGSK